MTDNWMKACNVIGEMLTIYTRKKSHGLNLFISIYYNFYFFFLNIKVTNRFQQCFQLNVHADFLMSLCNSLIIGFLRIKRLNIDICK